jgi:phage tail sheath gpL-like
MAVSVPGVAPNLRVPLFYAVFDNSQAGQNQTGARALLIGQTMVPQPAQLTYAGSAIDAAGMFGQGSMLARMVAAYRANDSFTELWCLPLSDAPGAVSAVGTLTVAGTASAAGTLALYVAGQGVPVAVAAGDTAGAVATKIAAAITAAGTLPVTAAVTSAAITLTATHKGWAGDQIDVRLNQYGAQGGETTPAGLTVAVPVLTGGATDPDLTALAAILGDEPFDYIAAPYSGTAQLNALQALMNDSAGRWAWSSQIYGGVFVARRAAAGILSAQVQDCRTFGTSRNDPHVVAWTYENDSPTPPWEAAAMWAGAVAPSLTPDPARPLQTLPLSGFVAPRAGSRFRFTDQQTLLTTGCALAQYDHAGNAAIMRAVTTYQTNAFGSPDQSYLDCETLYTGMAVIRRLRGIVTQKFSRSKLAQDGTPFGAGQPIITPKIIRAELIAEYRKMCRDGLCQAPAAFAQALIVEIAGDDPSRVNVLFAPYYVSGLRIFAVLNQFRLIAPAA